VIFAISVASSVAAHNIGFTYESQSGILYRVGIPSGTAEPIAGGPLPQDVEGFAVSSNGLVFGIDRISHGLFSVDTVTGATTNHGTIDVGPSQYPIGLAFDGDDRLLMLANANPQSALYEIDPATATASFLLWIDSNEVRTFAISGTRCYALGGTEPGRLFSVDLSTGEVAELAGASTSQVYDLSFDDAGRLWGIESEWSWFLGCTGQYLVRFDLVTGEHTYVAQLPVPDGACLHPLAIFGDQPDAFVDGFESGDTTRWSSSVP
jgi:hypothetical protein